MYYLSMHGHDNPPSHEPDYDHTTRSAQLADLEHIRPILEHWIRDGETHQPLTEEINHTLTTIAESIQGENARTYTVAVDEHGKVMGLMGMVPPGDDMRAFTTTANPIEFVNAYVAPAARGKGVGGSLAQNLEGRAIQAGHTEIVVNSGPRYQHTGWDFWTRLYGEPVAVQKDLYGPGNDAPVWTKRLPAA